MCALGIYEHSVVKFVLRGWPIELGCILTVELNGLFVTILFDKAAGNFHSWLANVDACNGASIHQITCIHQLVTRSTTQLEQIHIILEVKRLHCVSAAHVHSIELASRIVIAVMNALLRRQPVEVIESVKICQIYPNVLCQLFQRHVDSWLKPEVPWRHKRKVFEWDTFFP